MNRSFEMEIGSTLRQTPSARHGLDRFPTGLRNNGSKQVKITSITSWSDHMTSISMPFSIIQIPFPGGLPAMAGVDRLPLLQSFVDLDIAFQNVREQFGQIDALFFGFL